MGERVAGLWVSPYQNTTRIYWREQRIHYLPSNAPEIKDYIRGGSMVEASISFGGRTNRCPCKGPCDYYEAHRALLVEEYLKSDDIHRMWIGQFDLHISSYGAYLGRSREGNWNSQFPSKNHPCPENKISERVVLIATRTHKFPYF
ncbi:transposable element Tcb2 transposase [Trichonephila clavipes]|nr:transposable element Tcb2 transposase [Trichonephila clavipes]